MQPSNLKPGKQYHYTVLDKPPILVSYRYETLNYWMFDVEEENRFILLHKQQVINNITDL